MKKSFTLTRSALLLLVVSVFLSGVLLVNFVQQVAAKENSSEDSYRHLKVFTDVLGLVEKNYVEKVDIKQLVEGAIKGMLVTLDPHSSYLPSEMYKELQVETKGEFGGLGIEISVKDGLLTVISPIEDSPASRAGVLPGDQIIKIDGEFAKDLSLVDAVRKMRGPKGSPITVSVHREGYKELIPLTIIRDIIRVKSVRYRMLDEGFGYVRLAQFQDGSATEFFQALENLTKQLKGKKLHGLVIDIRNNPGGLLTEAIKVSDLFLTDGVIVYTDGRLESQKQKYHARKDANEPDYPIVALVNGGSASASEIVAGALQDHRRAVILGTQTFGKGSVQTILPMESDAALRLTTALYYTQSGRSIQAQGIVPDVIVSPQRFPKDREELLEEDESGPSKERDLPRALKNPKAGGATNNLNKLAAENQELKNGELKGSELPSEKQHKKAGQSGKEEKFVIGSRSALEAKLSKLLREDPQLEEALKLLKTWNVFRHAPTVQALMQDVSAQTRHSGT